ncbi:hypothetical protein TNCV_136691 [Trichonephila clavipes]|nr:hypothetical protein TNCV_136691 [Trichonephila clavipes]
MVGFSGIKNQSPNSCKQTRSSSAIGRQGSMSRHPIRRPGVKLIWIKYWNSTVHNFWSILQKLDGASAACQDPDTVIIRAESMTEITNHSNEFQSKDGTVVRIPNADFNIIPRSVTKNTTPCPSHPERLPSV